MKHAPRIVVLAGATATGKTDLAVECAEAHGATEIVVLDSRQLYRGLDVGTGKPDPEQRARVAHHLLDTLELEDTTDAMRYRAAVERCVEDLVARGVVPLLVGGAGFYLRALTDGFFGQAQDDARLSAIREELARLDASTLHRRLASVDPESADRLHPNDRYRVGRALEIHALHGRPASELSAEFRPRPILDATFEVVQLTAPRQVLHQRIAERTRKWFDGGWCDEVRALLEAGHAPDCPGLSILGYAEVVAHLRGDLEREAAIERIEVRTRRYARAQETWFRKVDATWRGDVADPGARQHLAAALTRASS